MALQGTLQDFGALETFQLIALQQKTGTLEITLGSARRPFVFENGLLIAAHEAPVKAEDPLVGFLLETGYLKDEDIRVWLSFPSPQPVDPVDPLARLTDMSEDDVVTAYDAFLQTTLDEILTWPRGRFQFHSGKVGIPSKLVGPWKIEGLLMESMRRLDELADLQAAELPPGMIPKLALKARGHGFEDRNQRALVQRIDGRRSLQDLTDGSALACYDLYQALRQLRDEGHVELAEWIPARLWVQTLWRQRSRWRAALYIAGAAACLTGMTLGVQAFLRSQPSPWPLRDSFSFLSYEGELARRAYAAAQLLEVYKLRNGHYPQDHAALAQDGMLSAATEDECRRGHLAWVVEDGGEAYRWDVGSSDARSQPTAAARSGVGVTPAGRDSLREAN